MSYLPLTWLISWEDFSTFICHISLKFKVGDNNCWYSSLVRKQFILSHISPQARVLGIGLFPLSGPLKARKHNIPQMRYISVLRWRGTNLLCSIPYHNLTSVSVPSGICLRQMMPIHANVIALLKPSDCYIVHRTWRCSHLYYYSCTYQICSLTSSNT